jgi:hypothetical protein
MRYRTLILLSAFVFAPRLAAAATFYCDGHITSLGLNNGSGPLWVAFGTVGIQAVCQVDATVNGATPNTCKAWLGVLTAAHAQQKTIRLYYESGIGGNPTSCAGLQAWNNYAPYFLQVLD